MADTRALDIKVSMNQGQLDADIRTAQRLIGAFSAEVRKSDSEMKAFGKTSEGLANKKQALTKTLEAQNKKMELLSASYAKQKELGNDVSVQSIKLEKDINTLAGQMARTEGEISKVNAELADYTSTSGKAEDSTVGLYKKIEDSNNQLTTHETELKKANSEIKVFGESTETLGNKLVALNSVYDSQNGKMELLQTAYEKEVLKSGEASGASQKLAQEMNNLQTSMNQTKGEIDNTSTSLENISEITPDTTDNINSLRLGLEAMIMEKVLEYLDKVADKIIQIGKNSIETAADIQAHDALFEQVFSNMQDESGNTVNALDEAYQRIDELAEHSGRLPTSLEEGFIKLSQQFMSTGADSETALELSTRAMKSATDAAAAYNIPLEDAQGNLQSFLQGTSKAGYAIGIMARESQLAAYAVEQGYIDVSKQQEQFVIDSQINVAKAQQNYDKVLANSKSTTTDIADAQNKLTKAIDEQEEGLQVSQRAWTHLDESIKQATRVQYVEDMQKLSEVTDQANREAEEYETSLANWEESQRQLNKVIGEAALEMLIPIMRDLTDIIVQFTEWLKGLSPEFKTFLTYVVLAGLAAIQVAKFFTGLKMVALILSTTMKGLILAFIKIAAPILAIVAVIGLLVYAITQSDTAMAWLRNAWQVTVDFLTGVWDHIVQVAQDTFASIVEWVNKYSEEIKAIIDVVWGVIKFVFTTTLIAILNIVQGVWFSIVNVFKASLNFIWQIIVTVFNVIKGFIEIFLLFVTGRWSEAWNAVKQLFSDVLMGIWNIVVSIFKWIEAVILGALITLGSIITSALIVIKRVWDVLWGAIGETVTKAWNAMWTWISTTASNISATVSGWLTTMGANFSANWEHIKTSTAQAWENLKTSVSEGAQKMYNSIVDWIGSLKTWWSDAWSSIGEFFAESWTATKEMLSSVKTPIDNVIGYFQGLWESVKTVFDDLKTKVSETWENVKGTLGKLNPANWFGAKRATVQVAYDSDPYNPATNGMIFSDTPLPVFSNAIGSLMAASSSVMGGINSAFNNLNGIYEHGVTIVNIPQEKDNARNMRMEERMDRIEELLVLIAQKELSASLDSRDVTSGIYNPMQNEIKMRDVEASRLNGSW